MEKKYRYRKDHNGNRIENEDIADVYNTVLKIAKKRAHIDTTLTVTGAADLFTQDLIDEDEPPRPPIQTPQAKAEQQAPAGPTISEAQAKRLFAIASTANVTQENLRLYLREFKIEHTPDIPKALYSRICAWAEAGGQEVEPGDAKE